MFDKVYKVTLLSWHVYKAKMGKKLNLRSRIIRRIQEKHFKTLLLALIFCVTSKTTHRKPKQKVTNAIITNTNQEATAQQRNRRKGEETPYTVGDCVCQPLVIPENVQITFTAVLSVWRA